MYRRNLPLIVVVFLASRTSVTPTLDLTGRAVTPGLVGMHDHLFYGSVGLIQAIWRASAINVNLNC